MNRNVLLLSISQASLISTVSVAVTAFSLIGSQLAPYPDWAAAPLACLFFVSMLIMFPAARLVSTLGRKPVFIGAAVAGGLGALLAAWAVNLHSFEVFMLAACCLGVFNGIGQSYRFAAVESVAPSAQGQAISLTLAGGMVAALIGPNLARLTKDLFYAPFTATFLVLGGLGCLGVLLATAMRLPVQAQEARAKNARSLKAIWAQGDARVALFSAVAGWTVMTILMTATPLAMRVCGHGFADTASTIQWHMLAMFAPSLVTGNLVQRAGTSMVLSLGVMAGLACVAINLSGSTVLSFQLALVCLGIAWNLIYVASTALLSLTHLPCEKGKVQAFNDSVSLCFVAAATLASSPLIDRLGWERVNQAMIPVLVLVLALATWPHFRKNRLGLS